MLPLVSGALNEYALRLIFNLWAWFIEVILFVCCNGVLNKKFEFVANDDTYEGEMKQWNVDEQLIHLANFKNGQEEGSQKLWYDNGKIRANYVIIKGKRYGLLGTKNCRNVSDSIIVK